MTSKVETLTHIDSATGMPSMVDVSNKQVTKRTAIALCLVEVGAEIMKQLQGNDIQTKKGPVFQTAIIAGTMAVKKTADLIPLCHPLAIEDCKIKIEASGSTEIMVICTVIIPGKTGVEMEALTGASVAALTIYDMCKALSHHIIIKETKLLEKTGGKSDFVVKEPGAPINGLVLAGGKSTRMKTDKGSLVYHQKDQREYLTDLLSGFCASTFISCNAEQASVLKDHFNIVEDTFLNMGPLSGILSAFRTNNCVAWLTVACDLPFLSQKSIGHLIENRNPDKTATCFYDPSGQMPEPLVTIWEPKSYPLLLQFLAEGITCPRKILMDGDVELLHCPDTNELTNANTTNDYKEALEKLQSASM